AEYTFITMRDHLSLDPHGPVSDGVHGQGGGPRYPCHTTQPKAKVVPIEPTATQRVSDMAEILVPSRAAGKKIVSGQGRRTMILMTDRRALGAGAERPASIRAAQTDLFDALPSLHLPNLDELLNLIG
ncbi:hypothetical protein, partial [Streptomyces atratus]|uniref:hypothetical protein n=1 Tax=Streptomyces atratus TaxID=1893 RepID=UPI0033C2E5C0